MAYKDKAKRREWERAYYAKNRDEVRRKNREWRRANPDKAKSYVKRFVEKNPEWRKGYEAKARAKRPKSDVSVRRAEVAALRERDPEEFKRQKVARQIERQRERWATDPDFRLKMLCRNRAQRAIRGQLSPRATMALLGCDTPTVRAWLERDGAKVDWVSRDGWHIDHVRPVASFDMNDTEQRRAALHYTNLQLLPAGANRRKHAKWDGKSWRSGKATNSEQRGAA